MTPKSFAKLSVAAVITAVLAASLHASQNTWSTGAVSGDRALPSLTGQGGDVARIELRQGEQKLTLAKLDGDRWGIVERSDYEVVPGKVRQLMAAMREARLVEPRTKLAAKHALLELEDPNAKDAKSKLVRFLGKGKTEAVIGELVLGKSLPDAFGGGKNGMYVRAPKSTQTWLADRAPQVGLTARDWVDQSLLKLDGKRQSKVTIEQPDGAPPLVIAAKLEDGKPNGFEIAEKLPEGKRMRSGRSAEAIARAFGILDLEDVRKAVAPAADVKPRKAALETTDGLKLAFDMVREGSATWVSITPSGTADAVKGEVAKLAGKLGGWQFRVPAGIADNMLETRAQIYEEIPKPDAPKR